MKRHHRLVACGLGRWLSSVVVMVGWMLRRREMRHPFFAAFAREENMLDLEARPIRSADIRASSPTGEVGTALVETE
jgi:hypothetical protein